MTSPALVSISMLTLPELLTMDVWMISPAFKVIFLESDVFKILYSMINCVSFPVLLPLNSAEQAVSDAIQNATLKIVKIFLILTSKILLWYLESIYLTKYAIPTAPGPTYVPTTLPMPLVQITAPCT